MEEVLIFAIGILVFVLVGGSVVSIANSADKGKIWKEAFDNVQDNQDISTIIELCGEPTEILENANGEKYLLSYGFYHQEGEHSDLSGCTIYVWKREVNLGYCNGGYGTQAMVFFVRENKIVFRYAHHLHTKWKMF